MSDKTTPGYDLFAPAPAAAPPRPGPAAPPGAPPLPRAGGQRTGDPRTTLPSAISAPDVRYRLPGWANALFSLVTVVLIAGLVIAVAIPMVKRHQLTSQWKNTTVAIPASFGGQSRQSVNQPQTMTQLTGDRFAKAEAGVYGKSALKLLLIVAARPRAAMSAQDQELARSQFVRGFAATSNGAKPKLTQVTNAGTLGGWFGCGPVSGVQVCLATDSGSMVAVIMGPSIKNPQSVALKARQATVTRS